MAVQYLCCTLLHTHVRYCYKWTFHCFPFLTPDILYMLHLFNRCYNQNRDLAPCTIIQLLLVHTNNNYNNNEKKACIRTL